MSRVFRRLLRKIARGVQTIFNVGVPLKITLILLIVFTAGAVALTSSTVVRRVGGKSDYDEAMRYIEIKDIVEDNFIDPVDRAKMGQSAAAAMIAGLGDKWSRFMSADEYRTYQLSSTNEYSSIGISILKSEYGGFQVTMVNSDSPAAQAGLNAGMVITEVDGESVKDLDADAVRTLIRSKLNAVFTITVDGRSDPIKVDCTRSYVNPVSYRIERTGAGYVKIDNFEAGSGKAAISAIENMLNANVTSFVIDLRDNPGGLMSEMTELLDYLLPKGDLYIARDKSGKEEVTRSDNMSLEAPMCLLVNSETYAEAEIFAAVIKEYQWAKLIGIPTTGKTRTQHIIEVSDGSAILLSTHSYLTPNGTDIAQSGGVVPDMVVYNVAKEDTGNEEDKDSTGTTMYSDDDQLRTALTMLSTGFTS